MILFLGKSKQSVRFTKLTRFKIVRSVRNNGSDHTKGEQSLSLILLLMIFAVLVRDLSSSER